jgi:hypothetical protein
MLIGAGLMVVGIHLMWTPLRLLAVGTSTTGEVARILRVKPGIAEEVFTSEADLKDAEKADEKDRDWVYLPVVRFTASDGKTHEHASSKGSQIKSPWRLHDDTGLPERVRIRYDPKDPQRAFMPLDVRVWFLPGSIFCIGAWIMLVFGVFWWFARKPIVLPDQHQPGRESTRILRAEGEAKEQAQRSPTELIKP